VANRLFDSGRDAFAGSIVPYLVGSFDPALVNTAVFLSDLPAAVYRARGTYLIGKTASAGIVGATDTIINAPSSAATLLGLIHVAEAGNPVSSANILLLHLADTASVLPMSPNGGDIQVTYAPLASSGIFKL
jgi:hypothetical protein